LLATLDVALRKPRTQEQYRTTLEDCRTITRQLGQLVERIMTLASLDAGTARTNQTRVDAFEVIAGCAAVIRPLAAAHDLTLETRAEPPLELDTDPDKLREGERARPRQHVPHRPAAGAGGTGGGPPPAGATRPGRPSRSPLARRPRPLRFLNGLAPPVCGRKTPWPGRPGPRPGAGAAGC